MGQIFKWAGNGNNKFMIRERPSVRRPHNHRLGLIVAVEGRDSTSIVVAAEISGRTISHELVIKCIGDVS